MLVCESFIFWGLDFLAFIPDSSDHLCGIRYECRKLQPPIVPYTSIYNTPSHRYIYCLHHDKFAALNMFDCSSINIRLGTTWVISGFAAHSRWCWRSFRPKKSFLCAHQAYFIVFSWCHISQQISAGWEASCWCRWVWLSVSDNVMLVSHLQALISESEFI